MSNDPYNDGTTTRWHKIHALKGGINLRDPVRSIKRYHRTKTYFVVNTLLIVLVAVIAALIISWAARHV